MARGLNKVMLIGNLGRDPELRYTPSGRPVTTFTMATSRRWTDQSGQQQEETDWFTIEAWDRLAEICANYLGKGRQVYVEGRLKTDRWTGQDGVERFRTKVVARDVVLLGTRRDQLAGEDVSVESEATTPADEPLDPDDLPF